LKPPEGPETVVLKVGDKPYTKAEIDFLIENLDPRVRQQVATQGRRPVGDQLALITILSQQARDHHLDQTPAFEHKLAVQKQQLEAQAAYDQIVQEAKPNPDEINKYYSDHASEYEEVMVRQIVVRQRAPNIQTGPGLAPEEAKTRAEAIRAELVAGTDVKKVAEDFKVTLPSDPKQDVIIQTEPQSVRRGGMRPEMEKAAFALKDGEYSEIFDLPQAQVILQVTGHKHAELTEVSPQIEQALQKQKVETAIAEIKKKTTVWMDDQYFGSQSASRQQPPAAKPPAKP
jgi:parvulin-like peptidyl-prolyl isomerase